MDHFKMTYHAAEMLNECLPCSRQVTTSPARHDAGGSWVGWSASDLFRNHTVGPFHERDEYRGVAELRAPLVQICLLNGARTAAGTARVNLNMSFSYLGKGLLQWRPTDWHNCTGEGFSHERNCLSEQKNLD